MGEIILVGPKCARTLGERRRGRTGTYRVEGEKKMEQGEI
jgi:hypothetical protein